MSENEYTNVIQVYIYRRIEQKNMRNTYGTNDFIQFIKTPKTTLKKYGSLEGGLDHFDQSSQTYRKISEFMSSTIKVQENIPNLQRTPEKTRQLQSEKIEEKPKNYRGSIIENKYIPESILNSCYTPTNKENNSKSRWETKHYHYPINNHSINNLGSPKNLSNKLSGNFYQASHVVHPKNKETYEIQYKINNEHHSNNNNVNRKTNRSISPIRPYEQISEKEQERFPSRSPNKFSPKKFIPTNNLSPTFKNEKNEKNTKYSFTSTYESTPNKILTESMGSKFYKTKSKEEKNEIDIIKAAKERLSLTESTFGRSSFTNINFNQEPKLNDFIIGECKGEGRFGKVYLVMHKKTGFICAMKKIKKDSVKLMLEQFIQEIKIQLYLNHPKLVKTYGYFCDTEYFYMLIEYMEEGSLYSILKKHKKLDEAEVSEKLQEICLGVKEMHNENIVHRDLKPENIVISNVIYPFMEGVCKICDFGWAAFCEGRRQTYCGTLDYVCPEIIEGETYDSSVDVWCIGIMAYEMLCGKAPFYDISRKKTIEKIKEVKEYVIECKMENYPSYLSKSAISFIEMILQKNPDERVGINELLESEFLKNIQK